MNILYVTNNYPTPDIYDRLITQGNNVIKVQTLAEAIHWITTNIETIIIEGTGLQEPWEGCMLAKNLQEWGHCKVYLITDCDHIAHFAFPVLTRQQAAEYAQTGTLV